jgi:hypothetical protein
MKNLFTTTVIALVTLTLTTSPDQPEARECDISLMSSFKLEGMQKPQLNTPIEICGNVRDNCCTLFDQMLIVKLWQKFSSPLLQYQVKRIIDYYRTIFSFHHFYNSLKIDNLPVYFSTEKTIRFKKKLCSSSFKFTEEFTEEESQEKEDHKNKAEVNPEDRKLMDGYSGNDAVAEVRLEQAEGSVTGDPNASAVGQTMDDSEWEPTGKDVSKSSPRQLGDQSGSEVQLSEEQMGKLRKIQTIKDKFQQTIKNAISKIGEKINTKLDRITEMKQSLQSRLDRVNHQLSSPTTQGRFLKKKKNFDSDLAPELFDLKNLNSLYNNTEDSVFDTVLLEKEREDLTEAISELEKNAKQILGFEQKQLLKKFKIHFNDKKLAAFVNEIEQQGLPTIPAPLQVVRNRQPPPFYPFEAPNLKCTVFKNSMYRRLYVINEKKLKYCDKTLWAVKRLNLRDFVEYLPSVQESLLKLGNLRKGLYCALCDYSTQKYIDFEKKAVYFNEDFCEAYVWQFSEYFRWKDIIFVEYLHYLMQTINCFNTKGDVLGFPFLTLIDQHLQKSFFFKRCFDQINSNDWFKYCFFICKEFKYDTFGKFIEGDLAFLKEIVSLSLSFLRKQNFKIKRIDLAKLDVLPKVNTQPTGNANQQVDDDINDMIQREIDQEKWEKKKAELRKDGKGQAKVVKQDRGRSLSAERESRGQVEHTNEGEVQGASTTDSIAMTEGLDTLRQHKGKERVLETKHAPLNASKDFERFLRLIEAKIHSKTQPVNRHLATNDFEPDAIYAPRVSVDKINELRTYFFRDTRGLNPILIDGLTNFNIDYDYYLRKHYQRHKNEELHEDVIKMVIFSLSKEEEFNSGLRDVYPLSAGGMYDVDEFVDQKVVEKCHTALTLKKFQAQRDAGNESKVIVDWHMPDLFSEEGMPELNYIIN